MTWKLHAHEDGLIFNGPGGVYPAECVFGGFRLEGTDCFGQLDGKVLEKGAMLGVRWATFQRLDNKVGTWSIEFPERMRGCGTSRSERGLHGFRLHTPVGRVLELMFTQRPAPLELVAVLTGLFEPKEKCDGSRIGRQLRQEPVPGEPAAPAGRREDGPAADEGREEPRGVREESGTGVARHGQVEERVQQVADVPFRLPNQELLAQFVAQGTPRPAPLSKPSRTPTRSPTP